MHVLKGVNHSSQGAEPPEDPSLELCPVACVLVLPRWEVTCGVHIALAAAPDFMSGKQWVWRGHPQKRRACCKLALSFLPCATLVANVDISSERPLTQMLYLGKQ